MAPNKVRSFVFKYVSRATKCHPRTPERGFYAESKASPVKESSRLFNMSSSFPGNATSSTRYSTSAPGGILCIGSSVLRTEQQGQGQKKGHTSFHRPETRRHGRWFVGSECVLPRGWTWDNSTCHVIALQARCLCCASSS